MNNQQQEQAQYIEATLFLKGNVVQKTELLTADIKNKKELETILAEMQKEWYNNRGMMLVQAEEEVRLVTHTDVQHHIIAQQEIEETAPLSRPVAEVLAIVAYHGPLSRAAIEEIRGVNCQSPIRILREREIIDRKPNPEHKQSYLYYVTTEMLAHLGLKKQQELPDYDRIKQQHDNTTK